MDRIRVLRLIEYEGPRDWVEETVAWAIHGRKNVGVADQKYITGVTITQVPEILETARQKNADHKHLPHCPKYEGDPMPGLACVCDAEKEKPV